MIESSNLVAVRTQNGDVDDSKKLYVESHPMTDQLIALRVPGFGTFYVLSSDLSVAITNATNTGR